MSIHRNNLHLSKSPYLQQHANNPVHWQSWSSDILQLAKEEDRLLIVSIGYSACHWCHVMEHEVFEMEDAATVMNEHYIAIKVDREERPDIDEIYMRALHLMNGQGGWPLNVICLPDGKPIWGGTYIPKNRWKQALSQIAQMYRDDRQQVIDYGSQLTKGIQQSMLVALQRSPLSVTAKDLDQLFNKWSSSFDQNEGGMNRAPKFPMPVNWHFLLEYGITQRNQQALKQVELSLDKMAQGGIYDQIGGGFARYSVDDLWKVPHFEKMLYDNAQLISLYSKAFRYFKKDLYRQVVETTWSFLKREMLDPQGAWYSALDADSEGEEGKFYVWQAQELQEHIPAADWALFAAYYSINEHGSWEKGNYILLRRSSEIDFAQQFELKPETLRLKVHKWQQILLAARQNRVHPGLDTKALTSWNALMISAACDANRAFGDSEYLNSALATATWILEHQSQGANQLNHSWQDGSSHIEGLLEDYAHSIDAFINLWQLSGHTSYLEQAKSWTQFVLGEFEDRESGLFETRPKSSEPLISIAIETQDNVIPSANSVMAHNLHRLGLIFGNSAWLEQAQQNLGHLKSQAIEYGENFANWARLALYQAHSFYEIATIGADSRSIQQALEKDFNPLTLYFHSTGPSDLAPFKNRYKADENLIYACQQGACQLPYSDLEKFRKDFQLMR